MSTSQIVSHPPALRPTATRASRRSGAANAWRVVAAVCVCCALTACAGQNMSLKMPGEPAGSDYVNLVQITPQVLAANQTSSTAASIPSALLDYHPASYEIGAGDTLYITVWNHPELTSPAGSQQQTQANGRLVRPDGTIYYPFAGEVHAAGMTIEQLRQYLTNKLGKYINDPKVDVSVVNYGSQHVLVEGAVTKTGVQPVTTVPLTLGEAIASGVVDAANANLSNVMLSRGGQVYHLNMYDLQQNGLAKNIYLKAGDRVYVPYNDSQEVYVMGEVVRPVALRFRHSGLTLTQAIGQAGGLSQITAQGKIYVIRNTSKQGIAGPGATVYELDAKSPVAFALADQFKVRPGDVVFASAAGITKWNRFLTQLLPMTSAISAAAAARYDFNRN